MANSARQQPGQISGQLEIAHTDFDQLNTITEVSLEVPVDMWITEVQITYNPTTPFDQNVGITTEIVPEQMRDSFGGGTTAMDELLGVWQTDNQVGAVVTNHPVFVGFFSSAVTEPIVWKQDHFMYLKAGQQLNVRIGHSDLAVGAPTAGNLRITIEAKTQVVNYNGSPKRPSSWSADRAYLTVLARPNTSAYNQFHYAFPTDLRIYNLRMMQFGPIGQDHFYANETMLENWDPYDFGTDAIQYNVMPQIFVANAPGVTTDIVQINNFEKGPFYYHKGESLKFGIDLEATGEAYFAFQCEMIPNYNNRVTLNYQYTSDDITAANQEQVVAYVPWDMYLESIETDLVGSVSADVNGFVEIHVIKPGQTADSGANSIGGSILEWSDVVGNQETGTIPATIVDSIPISADFSVTTEIAATSLEMIMDFVPAGSMIIFNVTGSATPTGIADIQCRIQLEGRNMVKSKSVSKFSYIEGEQVANLAQLESDI